VKGKSSSLSCIVVVLDDVVVVDSFQLSSAPLSVLESGEGVSGCVSTVSSEGDIKLPVA
jgi:hypothetical protein